MLCRCRLFVYLIGLLFLSQVSFVQAGDSASQTLSVAVGDVPRGPITYDLEVQASGLNHPSSIAFLPGGDILITERNAGLTLVSGGEKIVVEGMPPIHARQQAGLHDVTLHPEYAENKWVYFSYSHGDAGANATRLARAKLVVLSSENGKKTAQLTHLDVLFTRMPMSSTSRHYGGRIAFLKDATLLMTVGEGGRYREQAVELDNHFGKVIRLHDDGAIPADNPFVNVEGARPEIFTYGHRNPQGLLVTKEGQIILHEHGPRGGDEINILKMGSNYGWPKITYGIEYSGGAISPYSEAEGMEQSVVHFVPSIAPSGFTRYDGSLFPEWQGDLFVGALARRQVRRISIDAVGGMAKQEKLFTELKARIRDVDVGPDGALYFVTDDKKGRLYRVTPKQQVE